MKYIALTLIACSIIGISSSCCKETSAAASLTIEFIGFTANELDSLIIKENTDTITNNSGSTNKLDDFEKVGETSYKKYFANNRNLGNWYVFTKDSTLIDSIVNLQVTRITEKSGCPGYVKHELRFSYNGNEYPFRREQMISIRK